MLQQLVSQVVGWEGVIGSVVMLGGALPLLQRLPFEDGSGLAEDSVGSWCMVKSSSSIAGGCSLDMQCNQSCLFGRCAVLSSMRLCVQSLKI
jgi:hypothetical protein